MPSSRSFTVNLPTPLSVSFSLLVTSARRRDGTPSSAVVFTTASEACDAPVPVDEVFVVALMTVPDDFAAAVVVSEPARSEVTSVGQLVPGAPSVALPMPTVMAEPPVNEKFVLLSRVLYQFAELSFVLLFENRNYLPGVALSMMAYT